MTSIEINDCFDELKDENIRLENELKFANKCLIVLNKIRFNLSQLFSLQTNSNQLIFNETVIHIFKQLDQEFNSIIAYKPMMKTIQITLPLRSVPKKLNSKPKQMITNTTEDNQKNKQNVIITKQSPNYLWINENDFNPPKENPMVSQNNDSNQSTKQSLNSKTKKVITKPTEVHFKGTDLMSIVSNRPKISPFRPKVTENPKPIVNYVVNPTNLTIVSKNSKLTKPQNRVDPKDRNKCQKCGQKFASKEGLQIHDSIHHKKESPVVCPVDNCNKMVRPYYLKKHIFYHSKPFFACDWPGCNFKHKVNARLLRHKRTTHSSQRNFVCDLPQCDKRFKELSALTHHKRTHSNVKPFVCKWPECQYSSRYLTGLQVHFRRHTKEKPYTCNWPGCDFRCSSQSGIISHRINIHNLDPLKKLKNKLRDSKRKYVCDWPQCDKQYQNSGGLSSHMRTHTNDYNLSCEWPGCEYRTHSSFRMKLHFRIHSKEKPYICEWPGCKFRCSTEPNLKRHQKRHRKD